MLAWKWSYFNHLNKNESFPKGRRLSLWLTGVDSVCFTLVPCWASKPGHLVHRANILSLSCTATCVCSSLPPSYTPTCVYNSLPLNSTPTCVYSSLPLGSTLPVCSAHWSLWIKKVLFSCLFCFCINPWAIAHFKSHGEENDSQDTDSNIPWKW